MEIQKFLISWKFRNSREFPTGIQGRVNPGNSRDLPNGNSRWPWRRWSTWHQSILCEELRSSGPYRPLFLALHSDCVGSSLTRYSPRYRRSNQSATAPHLYLCSVTLTFNHGALNLTISLILLFVIC